jgi:septal ring factor EnvC (AmiA/AmiB activator)
MDKRLFDKSSNFFKKEGFYVILFVCLCIVATVAAITARNSKSVTKPPVVQETTDTNLAANNTEGQSSEIPNATQVKKNSDISVPKNGSSSTAVSQTIDYKFVKPVEGTQATSYNTGLVKCETIGTYKTNNGIEILAKLNSAVYSVLDGKVEAVNNDGTELGQYIVIDHQNGLKTVYANLKDDVKLKVGDKVKKGQVIGSIGETRGSYSNESYGDHLHFEVMKDNQYVNPAKYVTYSPLEKN